MTLNRRIAVAVVGLASALALFVASSMLAPRSADASSASHAALASDGAANDRAEVNRIRSHFDSVLFELRTRPVTSLTPSQRSARLTLMNTLSAYKSRGVFPHNYDFADAPTPYFVDRKTGTLCAVAFLLESTGRRDIVDRVARANNNVWVAQLAGDTAFGTWLDENGITLQEAARIQVPYAGSPNQVRREMALSLAAPVSMLTAATTGVWNSWGNADGHNRTLSIVGISAGVLSAALNARYATGSQYPGAMRGVASSGVIIGGLGAALSTRALMRHGRYLASEREAERARQTRRADPETSITPIVPVGRNGGTGLNVSIRF